MADGATHADAAGPPPRRRRADARRNVEALLEAAETVFASAGVDAPAKQITDLAGVGVGTLYRHFPQRSDLIVAVLHREIDACADAASALGAAHDPVTALTAWLDRYRAFLALKRGLARALQSDDPAFEALHGYFGRTLEPALRPLLGAAVATGRIRDDVSAEDVLRAVALLSLPTPGEELDRSHRRVAVYLDGLRRGAAQPPD